MSDTNSSESESLAIVREKERQKTKRYLMFLSVIGILATLGIVMVFQDDGSGGKRKVDIDITKGKLSFAVEKPPHDSVGRGLDFRGSRRTPSLG